MLSLYILFMFFFFYVLYYLCLFVVFVGMVTWHLWWPFPLNLFILFFTTLFFFLWISILILSCHHLPSLACYFYYYVSSPNMYGFPIVFTAVIIHCCLLCFFLLSISDLILVQIKLWMNFFWANLNRITWKSEKKRWGRV